MYALFFFFFFAFLSVQSELKRTSWQDGGGWRWCVSMDAINFPCIIFDSNIRRDCEVLFDSAFLKGSVKIVHVF